MKWKSLVFPLLLAISLATYLPSIGAGFVYDFLGWQGQYESGSFKDVFHSFGYYGHHQMLHLVFYSFYSLFNIQGVPWYLFFCTLHAVNGYLLFLLVRKISNEEKLGILSAVLFVLHPYAIEAVVWKACVHYLMSLMAVLLTLYFFYQQSGTTNKKYTLWAVVIYALSLFTLEISFMTPLTVSLAFLLLWARNPKSKPDMWRGLVFTGLLWGLLGLYIMLNLLTLGSPVGHYGTDIHFKFDFLSIVSTEMKYLFKHLFYARYFSFKAKAFLFDELLTFRETAFFLMTFLLSVSIIYFIRLRKIAVHWHVAFFFFAASMMYVLPVSNMYFFHLGVGMNDRFSYIPVAFLTVSILAAFYRSPRWMLYSMTSVLLLLNIYFQQKTLSYWKISTGVLMSLKKDFRWHDASHVFVLNSPDNYKGIWMASVIDEPSGIDELIDYQTARPYEGKMFDVLHFNMNAPDEGVHVQKVDSMTLRVTFNQWGNWWHRNGIGATGYENEYYEVKPLDYPYEVRFKQLPAGSVFIYQDSMRWKEFPVDSLR